MIRVSSEDNHKGIRRGVEITYNKLTYSISKPCE